MCLKVIKDSTTPKLLHLLTMIFESLKVIKDSTTPKPYRSSADRHKCLKVIKDSTTPKRISLILAIPIGFKSN